MPLSLTPDSFTGYMRELATDIMLPRFNQLSDDDKRQKTPGDFVTIVDIEMEQQFNRILPDILPGSIVVGEEAVSDNPTILTDAKNHDYVWLVDPLDGTNNFASGKKEFCVMVSLHYKGDVVMSAIFDPLGNRMATAEKGQGAYINGAQITCDDDIDFSSMIGQINYNVISDEQQRANIKQQALDVFSNVQRLGCAGHDFIAHCEGHRHFSLYRRLAPWDLAPGGLLLSEAGGHLQEVNKDNASHPFDHVHGLLTATGPNNWQQLKDFLFKGI